MKKRIILSLLGVFVLFSAGAAAALFYITNTTNTLNRLVELYQVEHLRQNLVIYIQTVQADLYTYQTPLGRHLDATVQNVSTLDAAVNRCNSCHHKAEVALRISELQQAVVEYKRTLSYYITSAADTQYIEQLKQDAAAIGNRLIGTAYGMTVTANQRLNTMTSNALVRINEARVILFATLLLALAFALAVSWYLIRQVTRPVGELVNATRMITAGNLGHTIPYQDKTEFGELAQHFNSMSEALRDGYERMQKQQKEIAESEWKFRTLSEFAYDWEYWIGENKEIIFMSASCERITGYTQEEFMRNDRLLCDIVHPEDRVMCEAHMNSFAGPLHEEMEFRIITKDGQVKWLSHVCGPIYADDRFLGRRVSNRDISDRKRLEEQLAQSQKMESLGLLAGGIAHDFNNLLTAIIGYASMLQQTPAAGDEKTRHYIQHVLGASERAQRLTSSLLAFSRKQIMKPSVVALDGVLQNLSGLLKRILGEDVELILNCPETAPVFADPHQIEQVVMNLATNARDAMPGGGKLVIELSAPGFIGGAVAGMHGVKPGNYVVLSVTDTGKGIRKEDIPYVFEPFFTTKEKDKGTGLGLSMVYGIVQQHGGFVGVYSEEGWGTTFKVYLPVYEGEGGRGSAVAKKTEPEADLRGTETILIAEDEEAVREFFKDVLQGFGYSVLCAADGVEAIRLYDEQKDRIDMVILDVVMPGRNGKEVFDHMRASDPAVKVLFMSGYTQDILTSRGVYEGGLEFISKPFEIGPMMKKVRSILGRAG
ncbi:MAG: ATP-binding protein [Nitrospirota bacterium]